MGVKTVGRCNCISCTDPLKGLHSSEDAPRCFNKLPEIEMEPVNPIEFRSGRVMLRLFMQRK